MSCCGSRRAALRQASTPRAGAMPRILIEYAGTGPVLEIGAVTGAQYHFAAKGARVSVDVRDAAKVLSRGEMRRM